MLYNKTFQKIFYRPVINIKAERLGNEILKRVNKRKKIIKIIDLGCGDCGITYYLTKKLPKATISPVDVLDTNLYSIKPTIYNGKKLPFKNNYFDFGYTSFTLHHCDNDTQILKELLRVCKKDIVIIEEIYQNNFEKYITYLNDWVANRLESPSVKIPFNFHSYLEWRQIFEKANCRLLAEKRVYQLPGWLHTKSVLFHLEKERSAQ